MRVVFCENALGVTRLGFSVSSKLGGAAARNLFKRRVRNLVRESTPGSLDIVVSAARPVVGISWQSLRQDFAEFGEALRRWREQPSG
jgi:ribonuclease P protein component